MRIVCPASGGGRADRPEKRAAGPRRRVLLLSVAMILAAGGLGTAPRGADAQQVAVVDAEGLNLRAEPGTWAWVVDLMGPGETVSVLSGPTADGWYQVGYGGSIGWAHGGFLSFDGAAGWAAFEEQTDWEPFGSAVPDTVAWSDPGLGVGGMDAAAWVNQDDLQVLAAPDDQSVVVDALGSGAVVTVTGGEVDGFVPIAHWSGEAWIWAGALGAGAPVGPAGPERWADVSRSTQTVTLYEGDQVVASYWGAMGVDGSDAGFFATANGSYRVYEKYADLSWTVYGNAWVRNWVAFDPERLNGFHSYSMDWSGQIIPGGAGPTGGCVALDPGASDHLFAFLELGSRVEVHW